MCATRGHISDDSDAEEMQCFLTGGEQQSSLFAKFYKWKMHINVKLNSKNSKIGKGWSGGVRYHNRKSMT